MADVIDMHRKAFRGIASYVILDENRQMVGSIAFKIGNAFRCFVHVHGVEPVTGFTSSRSLSGTAAAERAGAALAKLSYVPTAIPLELAPTVQRLAFALQNETSADCWTRRIEKAGFILLTAIEG